jgi:hypothetical protein
MKLWWMLMQKEWRLMHNFLVANGLILALFSTAGVYFANRYQSGVPSVVVFAAMVWHMLYLLIYVLNSLRKEKHNAPVWLNSPQSGWFLLSAKYAAGLFAISISLYLVTGIWLWIVHLDYAGKVFANEAVTPFLVRMESIITDHWFILGLLLILRALFLAVLGGTIYFIREILKNKLRGWNWLLFPILFIISMQLTFHFTATSLYNSLFGWGLLDLTKIFLSSTDHKISIPMQLIWGYFAWGGIVYLALLITLLFYFTGWLFDRKVEV